MMKKFMALFVVALLCFNIIAFADEISTENSEQIGFGIKYVVEKLYDSQKIECVPLDISSQTNMGFADDVAGDGKGGWTDQGSKNDMASFTLFGNQSFLNIPFNIINPANNNGKSCIILRGQNNTAFPLYVDIPVNDTAKGMYVLHSTAYGAAEKAGRYYFVYDDGTSAYFDIVGGQHINDFWGTLNNSYTRVVWKGSNGASANITLNMFPLNNPHPEKIIKYIRLESDGAVQYMNIVGITLAKDTPIFPMMPLSSASSAGVIKYAVDTWNKFTDPDETVATGSALDMSSYLDAPAGKHGAIAAKGDKLIFADGTNAKLWGTNIVGEACYPDQNTAQEIASRLARSGYNLVRFVNMDEQELTADRLDKLSYFVSLLKQKGIYVYFSLLGNAPGDGVDVPDGWKIDGIIRDDLIEQKVEFVKTLLKHHNKYTGLTIAQDPCVAMIDIADQNSMYDFDFGRTVLNVTDNATKEELSAKFNSFLKSKYKTTKNLSIKWKDLLPEESIEKATVKIDGNWRYGIFDENRKSDVIEFFAKLQNDYYLKIKDTATKCGFGGLVSGFTNAWNNTLPLGTAANANTDFVTYNAMFSIGIDRSKKWHFITELKDGLIFLDTDSTVASDGHDGKALIDICKNRVYGKPFVISEWGAANIGKLYGENAFVMAAFAAQQGWTPIQYCFIQDEICKTQINDAYSTYSNPVSLGLSYASSALYYNMKELNEGKTFVQNIQELKQNKTNNVVLKEYLVSRSSTKFVNGESSKKKFVSEEFKLDCGGVYWDMLDGVFFAQTPKVICFSGNAENVEEIGNLEFEVLGSEATIALTSLDGNDLTNSERMLFTIASDVANVGNTYTSKYVLGKIGDGGIVYNPLMCRVVLKNKGEYTVYPLNFDGTRGIELATEITSDGYTSFYTDGAMNFELARRK